MARGWGRSEEDQPGDKEQARDPLTNGSSNSAQDRERLKQRRSIELSLAHIEEQLRSVRFPERRQALESARESLRRRLTEL